MKPRVLFVSEAISLAHVARPTVLASALDPAKFDIHFASSGEFAFCHSEQSFAGHRIKSITPTDFLTRLGAGKPLYSYDELDDYVKEDMKLIDAVKPDFIVNDFRLSLGISARLAGVPLLTICNSHWSPDAIHERMSAPDLPLSRLIGHRVLDQVFRWTWPTVSKLHVSAANRLRKQYGLMPYASLSEFYCDGDVSMYAESPALVRLREASPSHTFIGPIIWSPASELPSWWSDLARRKVSPAYITLGSTGRVDLLPRIVDACCLENVSSVVSTAGRSDFRATSPDVYAEAYIPGSQAAAMCSLVICNGGSATAYQALAQGRPVLGICSNLDQVMTMQGIASAGAGEFIHASEATLPRLREMIRRIRTSESLSQGARAIQASFATFDVRKRFPEVLEAAARSTQRTLNPVTLNHSYSS